MGRPPRSLNLLPLLLLTTAAAFNQAEPTPSFHEYFGGRGRDRGIAVRGLTNGDLVVVGNTSSFGGGDEDVYLLRTDSLGNLLWERSFGGPGRDTGWDVVPMEDGGFTLVGFSDSSERGDFDLHLIRTDAEGTLLWEERHGTEGDEYGWSGALLPDGGLVAGGETGPRGVYGEGDRDFYLIRTDSLGDLLWERAFGGSGTDRAYSVAVASDGGFFLFGSTTSQGAGDVDAYLVKTDSLGNLEWEKTYGGASFDMGHDAYVCTDGGLFLTGYARGSLDSSHDFWLVRTDESGKILWERRSGWEGEDRLVRGVQTRDGGFAAAGYTQSPGVTGSDLLLVRVDAGGEILWSETLGEGPTDTGYGVTEVPGGALAVTGWGVSGERGDLDLLLVRTPGRPPAPPSPRRAPDRPTASPPRPRPGHP